MLPSNRMPSARAVSCMLLHAMMTFNIASAYPSGSTWCAQGDYKRFGGGGTCSCTGTVYYCAGDSNTCLSKTASGSIGCNNGVFGNVWYGHRKQCACKPAGCPAGQKGPAGSCSDCTVGQYQSANQFTGSSCKNCPAGQYQDANAAASCKGCGTGYYQGSAGQTACGACSGGQYQDQNSQSGCKSCTGGKYQNTNAQTTCTACPAGQWQNNNGMTGCKACPAGQFTNENGQTGCKNCAAGQYMNTQNTASSCKSCTAGNFEDGSGSTSCKSCGTGQYQNQVTQTSCKKCAGGRYGSTTGQSKTTCTGQCDAGYNCPAGSKNKRQENCPPASKPLSEWANYYCKNGIRATVPAGKMSTPNNDDTHLRTNYQDCPAYHTCSLGIAHPNFEWKLPGGCRPIGNNPQSDTPVQFYLYETESGKAFTDKFQTRVYATDDVSTVNTVSYSIKGYPNGCKGKTPTTNSSPKAPNFLRINSVSNTVPADSGKASKMLGHLSTAMLLNKEDCTTSYKAVIKASISGDVSNSIECLININILDVNEPPSVIVSTLPGHKVEEHSLPATLIGDPLGATDPEADIGLQQLVWSITSCKGVSPAGVVSAELSKCPIRIGACDGQLMVAEGAEIDYETYKNFKLKVRVADDGTPALQSSVHSLDVNVIPLNDPPEIAPLQSFTIYENPANGAVVGTLTAMDVDVGDVLTFQQEAKDDAPFAIASNGIITFVPNAAVGNLNFESQRDTFYLRVTVSDGAARAPAEGTARVKITVLDDNDKPTLEKGPTCEGDASKFCVTFNENLAHQKDLTLWKFDQDEILPSTTSLWACCDGSTPFAIADWPGDPNGGGCNTASGWNYGFSVTSNRYLRIEAGKLNYEATKNGINAALGCGINLIVKDQSGATSTIPFHVNIKDINDPPTGLALASACSVNEDAGIVSGPPARFDPSLNPSLDATCKLTASDEENSELTYSMKQVESSMTTFRAGQTGGSFDTPLGLVWSDINYFGVLPGGTFQILNQLNYEATHSVKFSVKVSDGEDLAEAEVTISLNDVNEAPWFTIPTIAQFSVEENTSGEIQGAAQVTATDPDVDATEVQWRTLTYSFDSTTPDANKALFQINAITGRITEKINLDYESHRNDNGIELVLRVEDGMGLFGLHTIYVRIIDVNEPPIFGNQIGLVGNTISNPYVCPTGLTVGDQVGAPVIVNDPDIYLKDQVACKKDTTITPNDWNFFSIGSNCQIYVTQPSSITNNGDYTVYVQATDQGRPSNPAVPLPALSSKKVCIKGKNGLNNPVLSLGSDTAAMKFNMNENVAGDIDGTAAAILAACSDPNVPGKEGVGKTAVPSCSSSDSLTKDCKTKYTTEAACDGAPRTDTTCWWNPASTSTNKCECRDQGLRFEIINGETVPRKGVLVDPFEINEVTGQVALKASNSGTPNYENFVTIDTEIHCTLGKAKQYHSGADTDYGYVYENGIEGICRFYNNDRKKAANAMDRFGYSDAAHLCAEQGSRLPTLKELKNAKTKHSTDFVPANIYDQCDYTLDNAGKLPKYKTTPIGNGWFSCDAVSPQRSDESGASVNVWTYNGNVATIFSVATEPALATSQPTKGTNLPVLCYVGTSADKPTRGYSVKVRCSDTGEQTYFEEGSSTNKIYYNGLKDDKYVFIEIKDVNEAPSYNTPVLDPKMTIPEDAADRTALQGTISAEETDIKDGLTLKFDTLNAATPFEFENESYFAQFASTGIAVKYLNGAKLDFETTPSYTFNAVVRDAGGLSASQEVTVMIVDVNEQPLLREPGVSTSVALTDATREGYHVAENKEDDFVIGSVAAWDQDSHSQISWSLIGSENDDAGDPIFEVIGRDAAGVENDDGHHFWASLKLKKSSAIDFETKQEYTMTLKGEDKAVPFATSSSVSLPSLYEEATIKITIDNVNDLAITSVAPQSGSSFLTAGGDKVVLKGTNIGVKGADPNRNMFTVKYGRGGANDPVFEATGCAVTNPTIDNTELICTMSAGGYGSGHKWNVNIRQGTTLGKTEGQYSTSESAQDPSKVEITTSYFTPVISSIAMSAGGSVADLATAGQEVIQLTGTNFGPKDLMLEGYYGEASCFTVNDGKYSHKERCVYTATSCVVTVANIKVECVSQLGIGADHHWSLEKAAHDWKGTHSIDTTSYAKPTVTQVESTDLVNKDVLTTYGGETISITGTNFGPAQLTTMMPSHLGAITGKYRNSHQELSYETKSGENCVVTIAHTQMTCTSVAGVGKDFKWRVTVAGQTSDESTVMTKYKRPEIFSLEGPGAYEANTAGNTIDPDDTKGEKYYIRGNYFGPATKSTFSGSTQEKLGHVDLEQFWSRDEGANAHRFEGHYCIVLTPQVLVQCTTPPGVGKNLNHQITIGYQTSDVATKLTNQYGFTPSYAPPVISSLVRSKGTPMHDTDTRGFTTNATGAMIYEVITMEGANFGPVGKAWNPITAQYNTTAASNLKVADSYDALDCYVFQADVTVKCRLARGAGHSHEWSVTVGRQQSQTPTSSYGIPRLDKIDGPGGSEANTIGGQMVRLYGNNFGPYPNGSKVTYGVGGIGYEPKGCVVISDQEIQCTTVPGVAMQSKLHWSIEVRGQKNQINQDSKFSTYSRPFIQEISSVPANQASAWGSIGANYRMFLKVNNSGLGDKSTRRVVKFDTEELVVLQDGEDSTRQAGNSELLAFEVPTLKNGKLAQDIKIQIYVWKGNREMEQMVSKNTIVWSYDAPYIRQIQVKDHPTNGNQMIVTLIGNNFGNIEDGIAPVDKYRMKVVSATSFYEGSTLKFNNIEDGENLYIASLLNKPIDAYDQSFVQSWNASAAGGSYDKIVLVFKGKAGTVRIERGGQVSNTLSFAQKTPVIQKLEFYRKTQRTPKEVGVFQIPTVGNSDSMEVKLLLTCENCGNPPIICPEVKRNTSLPDFCAGKLDGAPRDFVVKLGAISLNENELKDCAIVPYSVKPEDKLVNFECRAPAYQGNVVSTRIKVDTVWSEPMVTSYYAPTIEMVTRRMGGNVPKSYSTPNLKIPTKGYQVRVSGKNFGLSGNAKLTWDGRPLHESAGYTTTGKALETTSDANEYQTTVTATIPAGVSARLRMLVMTTGQFNNDYQVSPLQSGVTYLSYRAPTIVEVIVPLWRVDKNGNQGGYIVELLGYDFDTGAADWRDQNSGVSAPIQNITTITYLDTPCAVISTSYDTVTCRLGEITTKNKSPVTVVNVDGQDSSYLTKAERATIDALDNSMQNEDQQKVSELMLKKTVRFQKLVDDNAVTAGGLAYSMSANRRDSLNEFAQGKANVYQEAMATSNPTEAQILMVQAISLVQIAMDRRCNDIETDESKAILAAATEYDRTTRSPSKTYASVTDEFCPKNFIVTPGGGYGPDGEGGEGGEGGYGPGGISGPSSVTGGTGQIVSSPTEAGTPHIIRMYSADGTIFNTNVPTKGGDKFVVEGNNFDEPITARLVDTTGKYPAIPVTDIESVLYPAPFVRWEMKFTMPPGQGKGLILQLTSGPQQIVSVRAASGIDRVSYAAPSLNMTLTENPIKTTTDSCKPNQYESELSWAARIDAVLMEDREQFPELYQRKCMSHDTVTLQGKNFGADPKQLTIWVVGKSLLTADGFKEGDEVPDVIFDVFNGTRYITKSLEESVLDRGFGGCNDKFCFEYTHEKIVVRAPSGYGQGATLHVNVQGQEITTPFAFYSPQADYSEPRAYDAEGEIITIHGQNFGGQPSDSFVMINNVECADATWYPEHPVKGLPYIQCTAKRTTAGVANVSVTVAGQVSNVLEVEAVDRAGVRTVCKESTKEEDVDLETGRTKSFWGRNEPVGELCTYCPEGASCKSSTYKSPISIQKWFIQNLDISGGSAALNSEEKDLISRRERRDYARALEVLGNSERVCPPERLFDPTKDEKLLVDYPWVAATKRDLCQTTLPCKPAESCAGKNQCNEGYQWNELRCAEKRGENVNTTGQPSIRQSCNNTLQCQVKSLGNGCPRALSDVCQCPSDWELGSQRCLKECVRDEFKMSLLAESGCTLAALQRSLGGADCAYSKAEDCAQCNEMRVCLNDDGSTGAVCSKDTDCRRGASCVTVGECGCVPSVRCTQCTAGTHYRRDGKCVECPKNVELIVAAFFCGLVFCCVGAYVLDQKDFNLAFISIPIDYFQVLALFSRADIRWPPALLEILYALRFFNVNIDVATPECLLAGVFTYEMKFAATLLLPPFIIILLFFAWVFHLIYQKCCLNGAKTDKFYVSKLIGTFMLIMYFSFLSCTTRALEVVNCSPTDPDDGWLYVDFTDDSCDGGGLCRCGDSEHLPMKLLPMALLAIAVYTIGFPVFLVYILRCGGRKYKIKEDQILRAAGVGDSVDSNPNAFFLRIKFHKMYYYFKPGKTYWILYILSRKAGIAFAGLIFRTNPGFMLAIVLLILFVSYMMQIKHQPYMSTSQRNLVLAEHQIKVAEKNALHMRIAHSISRAMVSRHKKRGVKEYRLDSKGSGADLMKKHTVMGKYEQTREYFFDYNTVEQVLLSCAVLVCLAGVMFESDRFQAQDASGALRYGWQRDIVTVLIIAIVIASLVYLFLVFLSEVVGITPTWLKKMCGNQKQSALLAAAKAVQNQEDDKIEMSMMNPAMLSGIADEERADFEQKMRDAQAQSQLLMEQNSQLANERMKMKHLAAAGKASKSRKGKGRSKSKNKNEFAPRQAADQEV